jgi:eukaryotic-like serine/threonine-protein kinase
MNSIPMQKPLQNQLLVATDRYVIESILDSGGMGIICLAKDTRWQQSVVIKLLKEPLLNSPGVYRLFQHEIELRTGLHQEHIAKIMDSGVNPEGYPFYVMEYLQGESLEWKLQREKQLLIEQVICVARQICSALETVYKRADEIDSWPHLCPQNLKPSHIFLVPTPTGEKVKILDCGITQKVRNYCKESQSTNLINLLQGSFHYAAPEQLELEEEANFRADIYILGTILYEMLSGTDPFGLGYNSRMVNEISWIRAHTSQIPQPLHLLLDNSSSSLALSEIVSRCLQKNPDDRYHSIQALREALDSIDTSSPSPVTQPEGDFPAPQALAPSAIITEYSDNTVIQNFIVDSEQAPSTFYPIAQLKLPTQRREDVTILQDLKPEPAPKRSDDTIIQSLPIELTSDTDASQLSVVRFNLSEEQSEFRENPYNQSTENIRDDTVFQYSDSAIHNLGEQTICQEIILSPELELDETVDQFATSHNHLPNALDTAQGNLRSASTSQLFLYPNFHRNNLNHPGSLLKRFTEIASSFFGTLRKLVNPGKSVSPRLLSQSAATPAPGRRKHTQQPILEKITPEIPVSPEQHHKTIRELDTCRLAYAKELARNGKFRDAITMARKITDTSRDFRDAQTLIRNWEKF